MKSKTLIKNNHYFSNMIIKQLPKLFFILFSGIFLQINAQVIRTGPPEPPLGKRWVLNPDFSDEFNGDTLNELKWLDHHPTWKGRAPGLFMSSQVSVKDGYLQIKGEKMEKDTIVDNSIFNIKGGAVVSKKTALFGYYECRVKAAATTMSTTFWFSGGGGKGPEGCDKYHQEWDIQECIGRQGDFDGKYFAKGMHSNAHYWYTGCDNEKKHDYRAAQVRFEDDKLASEDFHVYGGWWRDENNASYYYDNRLPKHQQFFDSISKKPMDKPMYMRLVCETYPFPWITLPTDEELDNPKKNTVKYDWVRAYKLVDAKKPNPNKTEIIDIYDEGIIFPSPIITRQYSKVLKIPFSYKANQDREIHILLKNNKGEKIYEDSFIAYAGYSNFEYLLKFKPKLDIYNKYTLTTMLHPIKKKKNLLDKNTLIINVIK